MLGVTECVRQVLATLVPASILKDITSFVFYDHHPRRINRIDVAVCTKNGELKEYFQRDLMFSLDLQCNSPPKEIQICRNLKSEMFYLVGTSSELLIVSRKDENVIKTISNVEKYYFDDVECSGQAYLQVIKKDDAVPVSYDENFNIREERTLFSETYTEESSPLLIELKRKLVEAKYTYKCNEKTLQDYRKLRQLVTLAHCNKLSPNSMDSFFQSRQTNIVGGLRVVTSPWVKTCNGMLIISVEVVNDYKEPLQTLHMHLHNTALKCITYTTKSYEKCSTPPFWREILKLPPNKQSNTVCITDLNEVKFRTTSRIDLSLGIFYKVADEEYLLTLDDIAISSMDCMGDSFILLSGDQLNHNTIPAILASTKKMDLFFTHIKDDQDPPISFLEVFCNYLQMDKIHDNIIVYKKSPYHVLNGIIIVFNEIGENYVHTSVFTRSSSQIWTLIHTIQDVIPHKIVTTNDNSENNQPTENLNYTEYASSTLNRSKTILEYLDNSMIKMSESKSPDVLNKIGTQIDLLAAGIEKFKELKENLENEARNGIKMLNVVESPLAMTLD